MTVPKLTYAQAIAPLGPIRDAVLYTFRELGGDRERWRRQDWDAMARAMTAGEDNLELWGTRSAENLAARSGIRAVRRVLELGLA